MLLLVSDSRCVVRGDLVGSEGVVINRDFVDGPVKPLIVITSVVPIGNDRHVSRLCGPDR